jgi:hypothetical protein
MKVLVFLIYLGFIYGANECIPGCASCGNDNLCTRCEEEKVLADDGESCIDTCSGATPYKITKKDNGIYVSECGTSTECTGYYIYTEGKACKQDKCPTGSEEGDTEKVCVKKSSDFGGYLFSGIAIVLSLLIFI